jgi:pimeloyl-ACP methyl ester carboxylesterase
MTQHSHQTAPTQFVEANGIRFVWQCSRRAARLQPALHWHHGPLGSGGDLAKDREVILFNNAGVSSSSGEVPTTFEKMGANAVAFIKALGLTKVDVLGFSIGGFIAQEIALQAPDLVRRLVLVGTGPRGGEGMATLAPEAREIFGATYDDPDHLWLGPARRRTWPINAMTDKPSETTTQKCTCAQHGEDNRRIRTRH